MNAITIWNKGKRSWPLKNSEGKEVMLDPQESIQVEEVYGLRMVAAYPKDLTTTGVAGPSIDDIKRREQSLRDREANLDAREKALDDKKVLTVFEAIEALAPFLSDEGTAYLAENDSAWKDGKAPEAKKEPDKKAGRPPKTDKPEDKK